MTYRLLVGGTDAENSNGRSLWEEYARSFHREKSSDDNNIYDAAFENLHLYNAVDVPKTPYVDFDTEADAMVFKLKFS